MSTLLPLPVSPEASGPAGGACPSLRRTDQTVTLSVIVPVHNGGDGLRLCLHAILSGDRAPHELIVIDDGSTDGSPELAHQLGAHVIRREADQGSAACVRNLGARSAQGDILVFVDADVVVHRDALALMEEEFLRDPDLAALFGSYDDQPPGRLISRYKNLVHHFVHQHARRDTANFWSGCGALRRSVFLEMGGFDESYDGASIEDIDLGWRLYRAGHRLRLCPEIQSTHLKPWTFWSMVRSDVLDRAVPWTRLIARESFLPPDLNLDYKSRLSAVLAWAALGALVAGFWWPGALLGAPLCLAGVAALNVSLYRFLARHGGPRFALVGFFLHTLYFLYSSATFVLVGALTRIFGRRRGAASPDQEVA
jgi:glycosyltransferase involved in cell wall biosynthesis